MFMRNFGNTVGEALFGAILNGMLMARFRNADSDYNLDDVNLLLTDEMRQTIPASKVHLLQNALDGSLQWVYITVVIFAVISLLLILKIPRGKGYLNDNDRT